MRCYRLIGAEEVSDYRIVVSRAATRPVADLYGFRLREPVPNFVLPLKSEDAELDVNLQYIWLDVYDRGSYDAPHRLSPTCASTQAIRS